MYLLNILDKIEPRSIHLVLYLTIHNPSIKTVIANTIMLNGELYKNQSKDWNIIRIYR